MLNPRTENLFINDPVPKNVSKFPIHQTYLTDDSERTGNGGYKFKTPEVWSSARSGKKSIAIRSIQWQPKSLLIEFKLSIQTSSTPTTYDSGFNYHNVIPPNITLYDVIIDIIDKFNSWASTSTDTKDYVLTYEFENTDNSLTFRVLNEAGNTSYPIRFTSDDTNAPSDSFNKFINQPSTYFPDYTTDLTYKNVWDRSTPLNFHASFVPFDNYQYLGTIFDKWQQPIIYQDPNTSPLFNVWTTTDLKTPLKILYESFIIRFTFIISSDSQYS